MCIRDRGNTIPNPLSISMVVVTKKKIKSKKAISAIEEVGIAPPLNLRLTAISIFYSSSFGQVSHIVDEVDPTI